MPKKASKKTVEHFNLSIPVTLARKARSNAEAFAKERAMPRVNLSAYFSHLIQNAG